MSFWRNLGKDILGDVRSTIVTTMLTVGFVSIGSALLAAIVKAIKSEPVPWAIFLGTSALGIVLLIIALTIRRPSSPRQNTQPDVFDDFDLTNAFDIDACATSNLQNRTEIGLNKVGKPGWSLDCEIAVHNRHPWQGFDDVAFRIVSITPAMDASPVHHAMTQDSILRRVQFKFSDLPANKLFGDQTAHVRIFRAERHTQFSGGSILLTFDGLWPDNFRNTFSPIGEYKMTVEVTGRGVGRKAEEFTISFHPENVEKPAFSISKRGSPIKEENQLTGAICFGRAVELLRQRGKFIDSFNAICLCEVHQLQSNDETVWLSDRLGEHGYGRPFEGLEPYVPRAEWLEFLKWGHVHATYDFTSDNNYLTAAQEWRMLHGHPEPAGQIEENFELRKALTKRIA